MHRDFVRCEHCPAGSDHPCAAIATGHGRYCELIDPANPAYDPAYMPFLRDWEPPSPNLIEKAISLATAIYEHVAAGMPLLDDAAYEARLAICRVCPNVVGDVEGCRACGCGPGIRVKARWAEQKCPDSPPRW